MDCESPQLPQEPRQDAPSEPQNSQVSLMPMPSGAGSSALPVVRFSSSLTPLVCDERAISALLGMMLAKSGLSIMEASRRLGVSSNAIRQYLAGRRSKPSLLWFLKFAEACGVRVTIEFPGRR